MKKGFTLIELLTVIVILGVIAAITIPTIVDTIKNSRVDSCNEQVRTIESAAKRWGTENPVDLTGYKTDPSSSEPFTVGKLQEEGYLSKDDIINPVTKEDMKDVEVTITYDTEYNQYYYKLPEDTCNVE